MTRTSVDLFSRGNSARIKYNDADSIQIGFFFLKNISFSLLSLSFFVAHVTHDIECETFTKSPLMLTLSYVFIIYSASKRNGTAI